MTSVGRWLYDLASSAMNQAPNRSGYIEADLSDMGFAGLYRVATGFCTDSYSRDWWHRIQFKDGSTPMFSYCMGGYITACDPEHWCTLIIDPD